MKRLGDLNEPWRCPPSLERVFAKRHAAQDLRQAKGAARRSEFEAREEAKSRRKRWTFQPPAK
jgi:hypothetical protein